VGESLAAVLVQRAEGSTIRLSVPVLLVLRGTQGWVAGVMLPPIVEQLGEILETGLSMEELELE